MKRQHGGAHFTTLGNSFAKTIDNDDDDEDEEAHSDAGPTIPYKKSRSIAESIENIDVRLKLYREASNSLIARLDSTNKKNKGFKAALLKSIKEADEDNDDHDHEDDEESEEEEDDENKESSDDEEAEDAKQSGGCAKQLHTTTRKPFQELLTEAMVLDNVFHVVNEQRAGVNKEMACLIKMYQINNGDDADTNDEEDEDINLAMNLQVTM